MIVNRALLIGRKLVIRDGSVCREDSEDDNDEWNLGGKSFEIVVPDKLPSAQSIINVSLLSALFKKQRLENVIASVAGTPSASNDRVVPPLKIRLKKKSVDVDKPVQAPATAEKRKKDGSCLKSLPPKKRIRYSEANLEPPAPSDTAISPTSPATSANNLKEAPKAKVLPKKLPKPKASTSASGLSAKPPLPPLGRKLKKAKAADSGDDLRVGKKLKIADGSQPDGDDLRVGKKSKKADGSQLVSSSEGKKISKAPASIKSVTKGTTTLATPTATPAAPTTISATPKVPKVRWSLPVASPVAKRAKSKEKKAKSSSTASQTTSVISKKADGQLKSSDLSSTEPVTPIQGILKINPPKQPSTSEETGNQTPSAKDFIKTTGASFPNSSFLKSLLSYSPVAKAVNGPADESPTSLSTVAKPVKKVADELPKSLPTVATPVKRSADELPKSSRPSKAVKLTKKQGVEAPKTQPSDPVDGPSKIKPPIGPQRIPWDFSTKLSSSVSKKLHTSTSAKSLRRATSSSTSGVHGSVDKKKEKPKQDASGATVVDKVKDSGSKLSEKDHDATPTGSKKHKHKKHKKEKEEKEKDHHHHRHGTIKRMSDEERRRKAKKLAMAFNTKRSEANSSGANSKTSLHFMSFRKDKLGSSDRAKTKSSEESDELFVRKSILDTSSTLPTLLDNIGALFGNRTTTTTSAPVPIQSLPLCDDGPPHRFAIKNGIFRPQYLLRRAGAMAISCDPKKKLEDKEVITLFNNLTAKVTKAVRQNGGFNELKPNFLDTTSEEPRFAKRVSYRQFCKPGQYIDGKKITADGEEWKDESKKKNGKRSYSKYDAEMGSIETRIAGVNIVVANAVHLLLFGVRSPYGDTPNCESDMRRGLVTPVPVWIKLKPYVEMVINGMKGRGQPHIVYRPLKKKRVPIAQPNSNSIGDYVPYGDAGPFRFGSSAEVPPPIGFHDSAGPFRFGPSAQTTTSNGIQGQSNWPVFGGSSSGTPGTPFFDGSGTPGSNEFSASLVPRRPLLPPPTTAPPTSNEYSDYSTRIW